jgi:2-polyprenyl-6-methoxyphenol hydroxylase-like FAD-dependent oxidoreductase
MTMRIPSVFTTNPAASPLGPPNPTPAQRGVTSAATSAARARLTRETAQTMSSGAPVVERAPLGEAELHALRRQSRTQIATTLALVERALASPSTGPAALGRAIGRVGATIGLMRTVPPGSLGDGPLHALRSLADRARSTTEAASPTERELRVRLAQRLEDLATLGSVVPPSELRARYTSARETFRAWRAAHRGDPSGTAERFCALYGVPLTPDVVGPHLEVMLGSKAGCRPFLKATSQWMALARRGDVELAPPTSVDTLRPTTSAGKLRMSPSPKLTQASAIAPLDLSPSGRPRRVVIVGQGPVGLLTALHMKKDAALSGLDVLLVDKRGQDGELAYTRPIKLAVRHGFLSLLASEKLPGTSQSVLDLLVARGQVHFTEAGPSSRGTRGEISAQRAVHQPLGMIGESSVALIETRHLEQALRDVVSAAPNVHFLNGYSVELQPRPVLGLDGRPAFGATLHAMAKDEAGRWKSAPDGVDIGTPDMIFAADGAQSKTVRDAGIGLRTGQPIGRFVAGTVRVPEGPNTMTKLSLDTEDHGELHVYANVAGRVGEAWVIVDVPSTWSDADLRDRAKVGAHFRALSERSLGLTSGSAEVLWGGDSPFTLRPSTTTEPGRGNVWPIGDASGNNSFTVGGGTVGGAHEAANAAETILALASSGDRAEAGKDLRRGQLAAYQAAMAWHQHGDADTRAELGVRDLLRDNMRS